MKRRYSRALPQNVHVMPPRSRTVRLCGATSGGYIRQTNAAYLESFVRDGGGLCPQCAKMVGLQVRRAS